MDVPERIYLQTGGDNCFGNEIDDLEFDSSPTWCTEKINDDDAEYIHVDLVEDTWKRRNETLQQLAAIQAENEQLRKDRDAMAVQATEAIDDKNRAEAEIERLRDAVKSAYRKHHLDDPSIGWDELSDILYTALCESMGDKGFCDWLHEIKAGDE